ncbi:MAG: hypothetical protein V4669_04180 [Pseudomonadota bacterium]
MEKMMASCRWLLACAFLLFMVGCAGTIQRDAGAKADPLKGATYKSVQVVMTDAAHGLKADNPQFNPDDLGESVRKRMSDARMVRADGPYSVEVRVENFRVRHFVTAVVLSALAGSDSIDAYVRVLDDGGRQVHGYKVNASYSLGGMAGSIDSMRMGWLYDKFSELAVAELQGATSDTNVAPAPSPSKP